MSQRQKDSAIEREREEWEIQFSSEILSSMCEKIAFHSFKFIVFLCISQNRLTFAVKLSNAISYRHKLHT